MSRFHRKFARLRKKVVKKEQFKVISSSHTFTENTYQILKLRATQEFFNGLGKERSDLGLVKERGDEIPACGLAPEVCIIN